MKTMLPATLGFLFVLAGSGAVGEGEQPHPATTNTVSQSAVVQDAKTEKNAQFTVIGYLEKRDRAITIRSGPKGTVYCVATKDGKVLHENLTAKQLEAQVPEIYHLIKTGVAGDARVRVPKKIDARY